MGKEISEKTKEIWRARQRRKAARLREDMLNALGRKCAECGIEKEHVLTLDHKNNNGAEHKRMLGCKGKPSNSRRALMDAKKNGWPKDEYQVLCFNCNLGRNVLRKRSGLSR